MGTIRYCPDIQGLRAIAALLVILSPLQPRLAALRGCRRGRLPGHFRLSDHQRFSEPESTAWLPADAMLQHFYVDRIKRIAPAYFSMPVTSGYSRKTWQYF